MEVKEEILVKIASVLHIRIEAIKNFNEETPHDYMSTFYDNSIQNINFNPLDKVVELYERMLKEKKLIEKLLNK